MSTHVFLDDLPPKGQNGLSRPRKYQNVYDACKANPGKWTIWGENMNGDSIASMRHVYAGCEFIWRQSEPASNGRSARGTVFGRYIAEVAK